ncbi:MAG: DNA mismatch repair protein MutS [Rikenellaceae bacterium]|jgi:DNA mismatch repair protein MutS|nr:DNA mismatch repair protein MutS [Rikenellaceae bacterium]
MAADKRYVETPLMKQYYAIKARHPDAILLFRVGDFYETFGEDAIRASAILGITLTRRANGAAEFVELAGFPYHAVDTYLPKLVRAGERVAVCEQLEDPKTVKGIVKRGVTELVTPGVALNDNILTHKENTFLAAVFFGRDKTGVAFLDISTGEFFAAEGRDDYIDKLLGNLAPKEVLYQRGYEDRFREKFGAKHYSYRLDEWVFSEDINREKLCRQFDARSLKGFGVDEMPSAISAAGAILYYLEFTEHRDLAHISSISRIDRDEYVWIDKFTARNLELFGSTGPRGSFVATIDRTSTPMGGRLLRRWIALPLKDISAIEQRLDTVERLRDDAATAGMLREAVEQIGDLERLASRIAAQRIAPRELVQLKMSLLAIERLKRAMNSSGHTPLELLAKRLDPLEEVRRKIEREISPDPSNQMVKGGVIAEGVDTELDDLRRIAHHGKEVVASIQERESIATGIPSLKVSYNNVFGYYIEVRNTHKDKVPDSWIRKQTLTTAERYITAELKEYEEKIFGAEERMIAIEQRIYSELLAWLAPHLRAIQDDGAAVATIDCLLGFAAAAAERGYCRPTIDTSKALEITAGRHPVIETLMAVGEAYVPNDLSLDDEHQQIMMITGPNMSGKSALLRQTALIVLMAQMGSFVPASAARIGVIDKIFTRVGASDNISQGESTFMVEMLESASILNNLSDRSLLLLDEIGRGTSTYDGISIAWAMVEYIHGTGRAKTMFATHYHELNQMEELFPRVRNYNVSVREVDRNIIFMRRLERGGTEHSFGIHVARMAGMPARVVESAERILASLEATRSRVEGVEGDAIATTAAPDGVPSAAPFAVPAAVPAVRPAIVSGGRKRQSESIPGVQLSMFQLDDPVLKQIRDEIRGLDVNALTPLEALNKLNEIKKITGL